MSTPSPPVSPPPPKSLSSSQRRSDAEEFAEGDGDASPLPPATASSPSPTAAALSPNTVDNSSNANDKTDAEAEQDGLVGPHKKHTSQPSSPAVPSGDEGAAPSGSKFLSSAGENGSTLETLRPAATKTLPTRSSGSQQQQSQAPPSAPSTLLPRHDSAVGDLSAQALPNTSVIPLSTDGMEMPYSEGARRVCLRLSVAQMVAGSVICVCSFAAWRYPVIVGIAAVGFGAVGSQHYRSREAVRSSSCCCHPELYIAHQTNMQVSLAMSALLAFAVSIAASIFAPPELLGYAIVNALAALVLAVLSFSVALYNGQFQREVDWFHRESVV